MLTVDTITDDQINDLRATLIAEGYDRHASDIWSCKAAVNNAAFKADRDIARARCVEILNARNQPSPATELTIAEYEARSAPTTLSLDEIERLYKESLGY